MKLPMLLLALFLTACSGGSGGGSTPVSNSPTTSYDDISGTWTLSNSFKCYDQNLSGVTHNSTGITGLAKTLVISGQSATVTVTQTVGGSPFCDGTYSAGIYPQSGFIVMDSVALTNTSNSSCVFSYNYPAGISPASASYGVNSATALQGISTTRYFKSGNILYIPRPNVHPSGSSTDICFDVYTK